MRRVQGPVNGRTPFGRAAKKEVPAGCSGSQPEAPDRGKASSFVQSGRQPVSCSAHRSYKPAEGLVKASGLDSPVFRLFEKNPGVAVTAPGETTTRRFHPNAASATAILRGYAPKTRRIQWLIISVRKNVSKSFTCS